MQVLNIVLLSDHCLHALTEKVKHKTSSADDNGCDPLCVAAVGITGLACRDCHAKQQPEGFAGAF